MSCKTCVLHFQCVNISLRCRANCFIIIFEVCFEKTGGCPAKTRKMWDFVLQRNILGRQVCNVNVLTHHSRPMFG